jgi:uncharacterized damage-inducible protein DinB
VANRMSLIDALVFELTQEVETTKRHFSRIEKHNFEYKPHEKSMTMVQLASHVVESLLWTKEILDLDVFEFDMENYKPTVASSQAGLLEMADQNLKIAVDTLRSKSEQELFKPWKMVAGGRTVMQGVPKVGVFRGFIISHMIHHRGQLTVYMRMCDIALPKTYGPTADDPNMDFID